MDDLRLTRPGEAFGATVALNSSDRRRVAHDAEPVADSLPAKTKRFAAEFSCIFWWVFARCGSAVLAAKFLDSS